MTLAWFMVAVHTIFANVKVIIVIKKRFLVKYYFYIIAVY